MALANCSFPPPADCSVREDSPAAALPKTTTTVASSGNTTLSLPESLPYKPTLMNDVAIAKALKKKTA